MKEVVLSAVWSIFSILFGKIAAVKNQKSEIIMTFIKKEHHFN